MSPIKANPIGIDFGTTNSVIAYAVHDLESKRGVEPRAIVFDDHFPKIATAVYFKSKDVELIGDEAIEQGHLDAERLYVNFKRALQPNGHDPVAPLPDGVPVIATELAIKVIRRLLEHAEAQGYNPSKPILCHPVGRDWSRIMANICGRIGLEPKFLTEPAAALYYAHHKEGIFDERNQTVLLIDFGGGTCDFLIMNVRLDFFRGNLLQPKVTLLDEDRLDVGGQDVDHWIADELVQRWEHQHAPMASSVNLDSIVKRRFDWLMLSEARKIKEYLSRQYAKGIHVDSKLVVISGLPGNTVLETVFTTAEFRDLIYEQLASRFKWMLLEDDLPREHRGLLGRLEATKREHINRVILTGGSSNLPWLRDEILPAIFPALGSKKSITLLDQPDMAVAYGAALYAYDEELNRLRLTRFSQDALLIELASGSVVPLVKRLQPLPLRRNQLAGFRSFRFPFDGKKLEVKLLAENARRADRRRPLSPETRIAEFDQPIAKGTLMRLQVEINVKGEVALHIARAGPFSGQVVTLLFDPLHTSSIKSDV